MGSIEESLAIVALQREHELEYLKIMVLVNAILQTGSNIASSLSGQDSPGGDSLRKSLDGLKKILLPHLAEELTKKAEQAKKTLVEEVKRGPLRYTVVGSDRTRRKRTKRG